MATLHGMRIAFLAAPEGVEQIELTDPWQAVLEAGGQPRLVGIEPGSIQAFDHLDRADTFSVDDVLPTDAAPFAGLVLPGGVANPDRLRTDADAVAFVKAFFDAGKPVAAICHAPWLLVEADMVRGRTLTSWPSLQTDVRNAGGTWIDTPVHVCTDGRGPLVTSRMPDDLAAFDKAFVSEFSRGR